MRTLVALLVAFAVAPQRDLAAQYAPTQDRTLRGLEKVLVVVRSSHEVVGSQTVRELKDVAIDELRRAGLRTARDSADVDLAKDGVLNITFSSWQPLDGLTLSMDVMQRARLARTGEALYMMTWYYEVSSSGPDKEASAGGLLPIALKDFLAKWRAANGR
jgi:hypothetical protein